MAEYIDREAAIAWFMPYVHAGENIDADVVISDIKGMKAADVEPVQEWISVKDRLPDLISCNVGTAYSEAVIAWTSGRKAMIAVWDGIDWIAPFDYWEAWGEEITHWMPLPYPPKGE